MADKDKFLGKTRSKHPILWNAIAIVISLIVLGFLTICFLDLWTHHGSTTRVPNVIGMSYNNAIVTLEDADLDVVIADSVYSKDRAPGSVVDVVPQPGAVVKAGREVYVTIIAFSPETVTIDMLLTDISWKQAEAYLKSKGLRVEKRYVPSQFPDLVVDVKCKGRSLSVGSRVTVDDIIVLEVGQVPQPVYDDTDGLDNALDSAIEAAITVDDTEFDDPEVSEAERIVKNTFGITE